MNKRNVTHGLNKLSEDTRDIKLGALVTLPALADIPANYIIPGSIQHDQGQSDFCTAEACDGASELQEGVEMTPEWGFAVSKMMTNDLEEWGQDLRQAMARVVKYGSLPRSISPFSLGNQALKFLRDIKNWPDLFSKALPYQKQSYVFVTGPYDHFDNIRATIWKFRNEKRGVVTGSFWAWPLSQKIMESISDGDHPGHAFYYKGWTNDDHLVVQNSYGTEAGENGCHYFSRALVNLMVPIYGAGMFIDMPKDYLQTHIDNGTKIDASWLKNFFNFIINLFRKKS